MKNKEKKYIVLNSFNDWLATYTAKNLTEARKLFLLEIKDFWDGGNHSHDVEEMPDNFYLYEVKEKAWVEFRADEDGADVAESSYPANLAKLLPKFRRPQ